MTRPLLPRPVAILLIALALLRVGGVTWSAVDRTRGDFYASMPGAYVEAINPVLWNSPDMTDAWGYHKETYFHGPIQYLTFYPLAYFNSFAQIAAFLLPIYALAIGAIFWLLWRVARHLGATGDLFAPLFAATFLFFPLLQAYLQREFEVIMTVALAAALLCLINGRTALAGALFAYAAWFKYIPLLFGGYLALRRWIVAVGVFTGVSAVILVLSQLLFGLPRFFNNNVPGHAAQVFNVFSYGFTYVNGHLYGDGFCSGWFDNESTLANIRHGLCTMAAYNSWVSPTLIYAALCVAIAVLYLVTHVTLDRRNLPRPVEARRLALECAIITTICACFFFSHYYYLVVLIIPYLVLLTIYLVDRRHGALALWGASYVLVSAFVIPIGVLSRAAGYDVWEPYMWQGWFLYGELLLVGLLMFEYRRLAA